MLRAKSNHLSFCSFRDNKKEFIDILNKRKDILNSSQMRRINEIFREQSQFNLSEKELLRIYQEIMSNNFFGLDEQYLNQNVIDGSCRSLTIKAEGKEHTVTVACRLFQQRLMPAGQHEPAEPFRKGKHPELPETPVVLVPPGHA